MHPGRETTPDPDPDALLQAVTTRSVIVGSRRTAAYHPDSTVFLTRHPREALGTGTALPHPPRLVLAYRLDPCEPAFAQSSGIHPAPECIWPHFRSEPRRGHARVGRGIECRRHGPAVKLWAFALARADHLVLARRPSDRRLRRRSGRPRRSDGQRLGARDEGQGAREPDGRVGL
jgi:hypothetical protein